MKSDEEFIAGIYAKAERYQEEHAKQEENNVIHISSFQRKIKKVSTYAAGVAACFVCGIAVYLGTNLNKEADDNANYLVERKTSQDNVTQPITIESEATKEGIINEQEEYSQRLHCTVAGISVQDGIAHIDAVLDNGDHAELLVPQENKSKLIETGNEIILSVNEPDSLGNYSILINQEVYLYSGIDNGEKVFTSENHATLRESDLKAEK